MDTLTHHKVKKYGWVPDLPDARDHLYSAPHAVLTKLPPKIDLRDAMPDWPVFDQGELGSCTANAIAGALQYLYRRRRSEDFTASRLFIYYNERAIEGTEEYDAGARIRDGVKVLSTLGGPPESEWPYNINKFDVKPPPSVYTDALHHRVKLYSRLPHNLNQMKGCLASGYPFIFGFSVYDSFETDDVTKTGVIPMPNLQKDTLQGGHAVLAVGYDDDGQCFIARNSWGPDWGQHGYFTIPYPYLTNRDLADDFWCLRLTTEESHTFTQ
jgi:C1A family cysteine protease